MKEGATLPTIRHFLSDRRGATSIEYALIVVSLSLVIIASISMVANEIEDLFSNPSRELQQTLH